MVRNDLVQALRASPFRPFRLHISDGNYFEIHHPEMLMVTRHSVIVGTLESGEIGNSGNAYPGIERSTIVDLLDVTQMEDLPLRST